MPSRSTASRPEARAPAGQEPAAAGAPEDIIDCMARLKAERQPFALATVVRTQDATAAKPGAKAIVRADGSAVGWVGGGCTLGAVRRAAAQALADGRARMIRVRPADAETGNADAEEYRSGCASGGTVELFVEPILPRPGLVVLGASAAARALCELGQRLGFAVTAAALREDQDVLPPVDLKVAGFRPPREALAGVRFIVVASQGKRDREALEAALAAPADYVAFIGSRRKAAALKTQLIARGADAERVAAIRSPAGLDIGAVTPEEIALSILAEIVQERRAGRPAPLVDATLPQPEPGVETRVALDAGCCGEGGKQ